MTERIESKIEIFLMHNEPSHVYIPKDLADKNKLKGIYGPSNLKWEKEVTYTTPLEYLSSKSSKRILKAYEHSIEQEKWQYEIGGKLDLEIFKEWYELYKKTILSKDSGELKISPTWIESKDLSRIRTILIRDAEDTLLAGMLIDITSSETISCSYRAHEYIHIKDSSIAHILEMCLDQFAIESNFKLITRGTDTNLYGIRLSSGLAEFKSSFGFKPRALDYKSSYYPRVLLFLKEYEKILSFEYSINNTLVAVNLDQESIQEFILKPDQLKSIIY